MKKKMALCEGRHAILQATDGSIFENTLDPLDLEGMASLATEKLQGCKALDLYVTGLTVALVEVIKVCQATGIQLTLWHYNRDNGEYYPQTV